MKLKRLLLTSALALSFTVSAPSSAHADPVSAAVVGFIGFTGKAAVVATFVINSSLYAAGSWAIGKAAQALGLVKKSVAERQASVTTLSLGETPRELVVGRACVGGTLIDAFNFGGKYGTDTVTRCIALADHEVAGIVGYYVDDQYYAWTGGGVQPGFNGKLSIDFRTATDVGWVPPQHVMQHGGWLASDRLCGITHVWIDTRVDDQVWTQGHPQFRFVLDGLKAYDPRKDAALGYTGPNPHVWENVMTHEFTRNAEILRYNFQRGIYATGKHGSAQHLLLGRGLSAEEAPPHRVIAAANLCDELVGGEPRYTANGVISAAQSFLEVEEMFAAAMAGVIVQRDGGVEVEPGQAKAVSVTITDADLVAGEPVTFSEFQPDTNGGRINTVVPRYVEPAQGYKDHGGPPRRNLADLQEDGGPREMTLPLMLVTSARQADACAEIARRRSRLERRASIVLPPDYAELEEGDWIAWKSDRYHQGATVRYQITSYSLDEKWRQHLSLEEIASSVYGVPDPVENRADPPPAPTPIDALALDGVEVEAITLAGEEGTGSTSTLPAVRFSWDVTSDMDVGVRAIRAEVRVQGSSDVASTRTEAVSSGVLVATNGVGPNQTLECRLIPIGEAWRPVVPSAWITVATGQLVAGGLTDEATAALLEEAMREVDDKVADAAELVREAIDLDDLFRDSDDLAEAVLKLGRGLASAQDMIDRLGRVAGVPVGTALVREVSQLEAADHAEIAARELLGVVVNGNIAATNSTVSALATDLAAEALVRTALGVTVGLNKASAESAISAVASNLSVEVVARETLAGRVGVNEGAIVTERNLRIAGDSAEATARTALALTVAGNKTSAESAISALVSDLSAEVSARTALGVRVGAAEGAITTEQSVRAYGDWVLATDFSLMGARRGDGSGWVLNKSTVDISDEGSLATVLAALRATDGSNSSAITTLQSASGTQASSLLSLTSTVGGHTSSINSLFAVTEGLGSRWTVQLNSGNQITGLVADGQTRSWVFAGSSFSVVDDGNGLSYTPATGRLKIVKGTKKTILGASSGLILWAGNTSIADGLETIDNGDLGIGSGDAWFGGRTLSGPFDSGALGGVINLPLNQWTTIAYAPRTVAPTGHTIARYAYDIEVWGSDPDMDFGVLIRLAVTNTDGTGAVSIVENLAGGIPTTWLSSNGYLEGAVTATAGARRIALQIKPIGTSITTARARNGHIKGLYGA